MWLCYSSIIMPELPLKTTQMSCNSRLIEPQSRKGKKQETGACGSRVVHESTQTQPEETKNI
jgi:hypothetical protein